MARSLLAGQLLVEGWSQVEVRDAFVVRCQLLDGSGKNVDLVIPLVIDLLPFQQRRDGDLQSVAKRHVQERE